MKKFLRVIAYIIGFILLALVVVYIIFSIKWNRTSKANLALLGPEAPVLTVDNHSFRDLNKNGRLDVYEDARRPVDDRVEDLLSQMNLQEKAGLQFITMIGIGIDGGLHEAPTWRDPMSLMFSANSTMIAKKKMNHFNIFQAPPDPTTLLTWHNAVQKMAERTRLGIPLTIASDPRHGTTDNIGAGIPTPFFSGWPSPLGFGAIGDSSVVEQFADVARQEYTAVGIRVALHPQIDLATEPRWARISGSFSEDASLTAKLANAYIRGFQGDNLGHQSVACMTKHFPGGGPQADGEDAHFEYGQDQVYPGDRFDYHLAPFRAALDAGTAQIMPYYGVPRGIGYEEVGFGYNKAIISGLLRDSLGFDGVVCTDWGITSDSFIKKAAAWGAQSLTLPERVKKIMDAGCDMIGGDEVPDVIVELVENGGLSESRIDQSARRILRDKFELGLFDDPYLDEKSLSVLRNKAFVDAGRAAQRRSLVLLKNESNLLPLRTDQKVFAIGFEKESMQSQGTWVDDPDQADVVVLKLSTPYDPRSSSLIERFFHQGRLHFNEKEKQRYLDLMRDKPSVVVMTLERPTVFPEINAEAEAVIADFFCEDSIIAELLFGEFNPTGRLPVEIPSSPEAVEEQFEDVPYDSRDPLYRFGYGLNYE